MNAHRASRTFLPLAVAGLALTAGCTSAHPDRAGGNGDAVGVVLDMAVGNEAPPAQLAAWADQVKVLSTGTVTIHFSTSYASGTTDYETRAFRDVVTGKIATASLGARALDRVGVTSFQALLAPMLVDNYDLQAQVFVSGVPDQMLQGVTGTGAVGVAVLPGPMRKILGVNRPFLQPANFTGTRIGDQDSALTEQTIRLLGATAVPEPSGAKLIGVDGYEQQLSSIEGNAYLQTGAKYLTANLNLWPRPIVVLMGTTAYGRLTQTQRDALHGAAKAALTNTIDLTSEEDAAAVDKLCSNGMQFPTATPAQLAAVRRSLEPAYVAIAKTASTHAWIDRIQQLKDGLHAAPATAVCPAAALTDSTPIDGEYQEHVTTGVDVRRSCPAGELPLPLAPENQVDTFTVVFDHGTVTQYDTARGGAREVGWHGTYQMFRDTLQLTSGSDVLTMTWRLSGPTLRLSNLRNSHDCRDAVVWATHPWNKISR